MTNMPRVFRRQPAKKPIQLSIVNDDTVRVKTYRLAQKDLSRIKNTCQVCDARKTFDMPREKLALLHSLDLPTETIPPHVWNVHRRPTSAMFDIALVPEKIRGTLFPYQLEGVRMIFDKYGGRSLLGDDMGLGKTRQGLAFAGHCLGLGAKRILLVCPSYLRYQWCHKFQEWLGIEPQLVKKGSEILTGQICAVSYDMLCALKIPTGVFDVVMCDESHYVKSRKAKRTKAMTPLVRSAKYALLITGTPALNRPIELFSQLLMLRPTYIKNYTAYAKRYCNGKATPFGYDDRGSSKSWELHWILKKGFMVRRLKRDVLTQLPKKLRHTVWLEVKADELKDVSSLFREWKYLNTKIYKLPQGSEQQRLMMFERKKIISELFRETAAAKTAAVVRWVMSALSEGRSFIFFAYHRVTLDAVEEAVSQANISYMRIDGSTPAMKRNDNVEAFQNDDSMRIAILSIGAAGTGITLTRVSECVFGELYWVPGVMIQAEDRIHRLSQEHTCDIRYLLGTETLDTYVHPSLCKKLATLDTLVDKRTDRTFEGTTTTTVPAEEESMLSMISNMLDN